jgi:hypothetical protein
MRAVLAQAEARLLAGPTEPVHVYDLHETAMKRQAEAMEKERMVSHSRWEARCRRHRRRA